MDRAGAPRRRTPTRLLAVLVLLALTACGISDDEVEDAFADVPGVLDATAGCPEFACYVSLQLDLEADADQITDAIGVARDLDPLKLDVTMMKTAHGDPGRRLVARVDADSSRDLDERLAHALVWAADTPDVKLLEIELGNQDDVRLEVRTNGRADFWSVAEASWDLIAEIPEASLHVSESGDSEDHDRWLSSSEGLPTAALDLARTLETESDRQGASFSLTGVMLTSDRLLVGVPDEASGAAAQELVADHPAAPEGLVVEVAVTDDVSLYSRLEPDERDARARVIEVLEDAPGVASVRMGERGVEVALEAGLADGVPLVDALRREAPAELASTRLHFIQDLGDTVVELVAGGDEALLLLGHELLTSGPPGSRLEISQEEGEPPHVGLEVLAPALAPQLTRVATVLARHQGSTKSYSMSVKAVDAEGRSPTTGWTVRIAGDGPVITEARGTDEQAAELRTAWAEGLTRATR